MFATFLLSLTPIVTGNILAVDVGNQLFKAAVVSPGRFDVVMNQQSKRKTVTAVSFAGEIRSFGDEASRDFGKNPSKVPTNFRWLIGAGHLASERDARSPSAAFFPYSLKFNETSSVVTFDNIVKNVPVNDSSLSAEEILSHVLRFAKVLGDDHARADIKEVILCVSSFATQRERQGYLHSAKIAGFNRVSLVHETAAAAIQRALDLEISNSTAAQTVLILNMGASHTEACVAKFSAVTVNGKVGPAAQILGCAQSLEAGGAHIDVALATLMGQKFAAKHPKKAAAFAKDLRAQVRLLRQAESTKLMLSANKEASFSVEGLFDDTDFRQPLTRVELEAIAAPVISRVIQVAKDALAVAGISKVDATEVIGGGWRMPKILADLQATFGDVGQRLNGDEAPVMGAAFAAANESSSFKVGQKVYFTDYSANEYSVKLGDGKAQTLISRGSKFGAKKVLKTPVPSVATELRGEISENGTPIEAVIVSGFNQTAGGQLYLKFEFDQSGLIRIISAEQESTEGNVTARVALNMSSIALGAQPMSADEVVEAKARLARMIQRDTDAHALLAARNDLESFVYSTRSKINDDSIWQKVTTETERQKLLEILSTNEEWIYSAEAAAADKAGFVAKLSEVKIEFTEATVRADEFVARADLDETVKAIIAEVQDATEHVLKNKTWMSPEDVYRLRNETEELQTFFADVKEKQKSRSASESPAFLVKDVKKKLAVISKEAKRLVRAKYIPPVTTRAPKTKFNQTEIDELLKKLNITEDGTATETEKETESTDSTPEVVQETTAQPPVQQEL